MSNKSPTLASLQAQSSESLFAHPPKFFTSIGTRLQRAREVFELQWSRRDGAALETTAVDATSARSDELALSKATQHLMSACHIESIAALSDIENGQASLEKWGPILGWFAVVLCIPVSQLVTPPPNSVPAGASILMSGGTSSRDAKQAGAEDGSPSPSSPQRIWFCGKRIRECRERARIPIDTVVSSVPNLTREDYKLIEACGCQEFEYWTAFLHDFSALTEAPLFSLIVAV